MGKKDNDKKVGPNVERLCSLMALCLGVVMVVIYLSLFALSEHLFMLVISIFVTNI